MFGNTAAGIRRSDLSRVRSASYIVWEGVGDWIAEASKRFPNRLSTAAFAAPGNQFCTGTSLSKGDGQLILETKIDRCNRLIVR